MPSHASAGSGTFQNPTSEQSFRYFFSLVVSLFILCALFLELDLRRLIFADLEKNNSEEENTIIRALLENAQPVKSERRKTVRFLSDQESEAQGKITQEKGFESITTDYVLSPGEMHPLRGRILSGRELARILTAKESRVRIAITQDTPGTAAAAADRLRIPAYYRFRHDFALSWDYLGRPAIPTTRFAHYSYFRAMINKIQSVWAPPGGEPYPTFGDSYHRMNYAAGYMRFTAFPSQDIYVLFLLDEQGVVRDARIVSSLGYQSLDQSCIEALYAAHDFGPPPKELLDGNGVLIIPFIFRIIVR
ncbi:MAG: energy transducer TonB [Turneriella sp.]|nr:energy transducer TonB [Leptospiraceae bacterium]MCX7632649.1 energy transducer TonB [Turneriella sp.]